MPRAGSGLKIRKSSESTAFDLSGAGDISVTEVSVFLATQGYETGFEDDRPVWLPAESGPDKSLTEWQEQIPYGNNRIQSALIGGLCLFSPPAFVPSLYKKTDMDILQQSGAFCLSSALKDTVIQPEAGVQVTFATGGNAFLQEIYALGSENRTCIRGPVKLFPVCISRTVLRGDFVITLTPDGSVPATVHTTVLYGLAETDIPAADFLSGHFPTLLPGEKITYAGQKEFLSFCPDGATAVVAAVHRLSGVQETKGLQIGTVGQTVTVDVSPAALFNNPEETGCFVITAGNRHFTFYVKPELLPEHTRFLSVNSFGVVETFIPAAITTWENKYGCKFGQFSGPYRKYFVEAVKNYTAGTGVPTGYMADRIEDLFPSRDVFLLTGAGVAKETVIKELTVK